MSDSEGLAESVEGLWNFGRIGGVGLQSKQTCT